MSSESDAASALSRINHFVVLMLENRSFDHLLGSLKSANPAVEGSLSGEYSNRLDPSDPTSPAVQTGPASGFSMPYDPGHEFADVQLQLYGPGSPASRSAGVPVDPAPMSGFVYSALDAASSAAEAGLVMQGYQPAQLPVLMTLAQQFALFNRWHSPLPGPTWPNRFFARAGTSGGLSDSPSDPQILAGFTFSGGTIYQRLEGAGKNWHIYHDGLPQAAGIDHLRTEMLNIFTPRFRDMDDFESDLAADAWPEYIFIEPNYDTGHRYVRGNSMHPLNDVRHGEALVKRVYEALRNSRYWADTVLLITFDEHGGFFDHVAPPAATPPGDAERYADGQHPFAFDRLGVRVPAIVVSPYTRANTVLGQGPQDALDHSAILKTLEKRYGLSPLTARDQASATLEPALNLAQPRLQASEAPLTLPNPPPEGLIARVKEWIEAPTVDDNVPLSPGQRVQLTLAHACNLRMLEGDTARPAAQQRYETLTGRKAQADYVQEVEDRIRARRQRG